MTNDEYRAFAQFEAFDNDEILKKFTLNQDSNRDSSSEANHNFSDCDETDLNYESEASRAENPEFNFTGNNFEEWMEKHAKLACDEDYENQEMTQKSQNSIPEGQYSQILKTCYQSDKDGYQSSESQVDCSDSINNNEICIISSSDNEFYEDEAMESDHIHADCNIQTDQNYQNSYNESEYSDITINGTKNRNKFNDTAKFADNSESESMKSEKYTNEAKLSFDYNHLLNNSANKNSEDFCFQSGGNGIYNSITKNNNIREMSDSSCNDIDDDSAHSNQDCTEQKFDSSNVINSISDYDYLRNTSIPTPTKNSKNINGSIITKPTEKNLKEIKFNADEKFLDNNKMSHTNKLEILEDDNKIKFSPGFLQNVKSKLHFQKDTFSSVNSSYNPHIILQQNEDNQKDIIQQINKVDEKTNLIEPKFKEVSTANSSNKALNLDTNNSTSNVLKVTNSGESLSNIPPSNFKNLSNRNKNSSLALNETKKWNDNLSQALNYLKKLTGKADLLVDSITKIPQDLSDYSKNGFERLTYLIDIFNLETDSCVTSDVLKRNSRDESLYSKSQRNHILNTYIESQNKKFLLNKNAESSNYDKKKDHKLETMFEKDSQSKCNIQLLLSDLSYNRKSLNSSNQQLEQSKKELNYYKAKTMELEKQEKSFNEENEELKMQILELKSKNNILSAQVNGFKALNKNNRDFRKSLGTLYNKSDNILESESVIYKKTNGELSAKTPQPIKRNQNLTGSLTDNFKNNTRKYFNLSKSNNIVYTPDSIQNIDSNRMISRSLNNTKRTKALEILEESKRGRYKPINYGNATNQYNDLSSNLQSQNFESNVKFSSNLKNVNNITPKYIGKLVDKRKLEQNINSSYNTKTPTTPKLYLSNNYKKTRLE
ncbi:hypothetical protein BB561_006007 [Smittium simulii]|uniref:Uncharacterized protein n=1 Tax=Smittium simulii TaxID=133385 RepID=A0A2T9Y750_9FUNG|nr:hypothetical protein BB561_006007 [Smittium simulii]